MKVTIVAALAAALFALPAILPGEDLAFTGSAFTNFSGSDFDPGAIDANGSAGAPFVLSSNLAANLNNSNVSSLVTSYGIVDGVDTFTAGDSSLTLYVSTNADAQITDWFFGAVSSSDSGSYVYDSGPGSDVTADGGSYTGAASKAYAEYQSVSEHGDEVGGAQSFVNESATPEPGTAGMMLGGAMLILGVKVWRKFRPQDKLPALH